MGGRLDATNVVTPLVGVITNVTMDHEQYLGETLTAVAGEKAGIIKEGVPVVSGVGPDESRAVVEAVALERRAPLFLLGRDFKTERAAGGYWRYLGAGPGAWRLDNLRCGLVGDYQIDNAALALAALERLAGIFPVPEEAIREGLLAVRWPGRLEAFCLSGGQRVECPARGGADPSLRRYLLDGAHNPAGVESLKAALQDDFAYDRLILVWACMADKDVARTLRAVSPLADHIVFTRPESERSATPEALAALLPEGERGKAASAMTVAGALALAGTLAAENDLICVAGSLYLVGAARRILLGELVDA